MARIPIFGRPASAARSACAPPPAFARLAACAVMICGGALAQSKPASAPAPGAETRPAELPIEEFFKINEWIRANLPKGKGKDADAARANHFREAQKRLAAFLAKYEGKPETYSARVARATVSLALGDRAEASRDLEVVLAAFGDAHEGAKLDLRLEALRWYCESDPAKARALVEALAKSPGPEKDQAPRFLLRIEASEKLREGKPCMEFSARTITGELVTNATYLGKVVLVHCWQSGIAESLEEVRALKKLRREAGPKGFEILGICMDGKKIRSVPGRGEPAGTGVDGLRRFVSDFQMPWPEIYDGGGNDSRMAQIFNVGSLPWNLLIDRKGTIRGVAIPIDEVPARVEALLGER